MKKERLLKVLRVTKEVLILLIKLASTVATVASLFVVKRADRKKNCASKYVEEPEIVVVDAKGAQGSFEEPDSEDAHDRPLGDNSDNKSVM
jgi:hypothetical protein